MNRQLMWSIGLLGAALVIAVLMVVLRPAPAEEERVAEAPLVEAVAFEAAAGPIAVLASGTVQAREEVVVGVQVSGRLTYVHPSFREGGVIGAGDTLLRIEQAEYLNNVRIAQADVAAQDVSVLQAEEEVAVARDELSRFAERQVGNTEQRGATTQILPPTNLDRSAPAPNENGSEEGTSVNGVLATREPQLRSAQAARERAAANLADAQLSLNRTRVTAPFRGLVRQEDAALGSLVQPGQALGTIVSTDAFEVRISLTPDEAALIPGLLSGSGPRIPANVFYDYGGRTYRWPAFIDRASSILDAATRNVEVFLQVPSPLSGGQLVGSDGEDQADQTGDAPPLLLGAFVSAEITGASLNSFAAVPARAVRPGNEIWVVRDGKLAILPVRVIQRTDEVAYVVTATLGEGGAIIVSSLTAPIEGMPVRIAVPDSE